MTSQLSIDFSRALGESAATACANAAEARGWDKEGAAKFVIGFLHRHGPTPGETLVDEAVRHGYRCADTRAYGAIFQSLARKGLIRTTGFCLRSKGNGTAGGRIWEAK